MGHVECEGGVAINVFDIPSSTGLHSTPGRYSYWPRSCLRHRIILLLLGAWPEPLTLAELADQIGVDNRHTLVLALSWLRQRGIVVRVARGVYALSVEYKEHFERLKTKLLTCKESLTRSQSHWFETKLTSKYFIEQVKKAVTRIAEKMYRDKLEPVDYVVLSVLTEKALSGGSVYLKDGTGEGLGAALARYLGSSSNYTSWELADSLKRLAELGLVYVMFKERKVRIDRGLLEEAMRAVVEFTSQGPINLS